MLIDQLLLINFNREPLPTQDSRILVQLGSSSQETECPGFGQSSLLVISSRHWTSTSLNIGSWYLYALLLFDLKIVGTLATWRTRARNGTVLQAAAVL